MESVADKTGPAVPLLIRVGKLFEKELAQENDYLRAENKILRSKLGTRIQLTENDRRTLVRFGMPIKDRLRDVVSIVKPETLLAWNRTMKCEKWTFQKTQKRSGRPAKGAGVENTIIRLAEENTWGYQRITGEMKKLGHDVSGSYVRDVLKKHGLPPSPQRKGLSWKQFIDSHMDVTWATDFFTEEVWTSKGLVTFYILFFIHLGTRRVYVSGATPNPNAEWVKQQARNFCAVIDEYPNDARYLIHDRDCSFLPLDFVLKSESIKAIRTPPSSPNCNAFAERWIREARETLNQFIIMGRGHLMHILKQVEAHHNSERPHQGLENEVPIPISSPPSPARENQIQCNSRLGGLLNHYAVKAAA